MFDLSSLYISPPQAFHAPPLGYFHGDTLGLLGFTKVVMRVLNRSHKLHNQMFNEQTKSLDMTNDNSH